MRGRGTDIFPQENRFFETGNGILYNGDVLTVLKTLPDESIDCIVTSPPYWGLRDYGVEGQVGLEPTLEEYIKKILQITVELKRVLKKTGVAFWNHGSNYQDKCDTMQNYRLILKMIDEQSWILRNIIIWHKPNHMPASVKDRFANAYEPVFMLVKNKKYWFDLDAVRVPHKTQDNLPTHSGQPHSKGQQVIGKNPGDVWTIPTQPFPEAHFATYSEKLIEPMIKAGCPQWICRKCGKAKERITKTEHLNEKVVSTTAERDNGSGRNWAGKRFDAKHYTIGWTDCGCNAGWVSGVVLDPFMGSGTTALVAEKLGRRWIGIELNPKYCEIAKKRITTESNQVKLFV